MPAWKQTFAQRGPDAAGDRVEVGIGVDQHAALGLVRRDLAIGLAQALMELEILPLEPVRCAAAAPRGSALQADLDRQVEDDGEIRLEIADRDPLHRVDERGRHAAETALIGPRRVGETIAQHPCAPIERGLDQCADMVVARGGKQQRLGLGSEQLTHP